MKHVFIDTNVLLRIYGFTDDYPNLIQEILNKIDEKQIKIYLTQQIIDEFHRNREAHLNASLKIIKELEKIKFNTPSFCKNIPNIKTIQKKFQEVNTLAKKTYKKLLKGSIDEKLDLDRLFKKLYDKIEIIPVESSIIQEARERYDLGNPPGKNKSYGDAINWLILLNHVPNKQKLFLITTDRDYLSQIDENCVNSFLKNEWRRKKKSNIELYKSISRFLKEEFKEKTITEKQIKDEEKNDGVLTVYAGDINRLRHSEAIHTPWHSEGLSFLELASSIEKETKCYYCQKIIYITEGIINTCPYCKRSNF